MSLPTYWHGGSEITGEVLLPAVRTGMYGMAHNENAQFVYFTPHVGLALYYALTVKSGWLYEVEPLGAIERDPACLPGDAFRCEEGARILRRIELSPEVMARAFELLPFAARPLARLATDLRRLAAIAGQADARAAGAGKPPPTAMRHLHAPLLIAQGTPLTALQP